MAHLHESMATLLVCGDALVPSKITQLLGCDPPGEQTKGQIFTNKRNGEERIAKTGMWRLDAAIAQPENLDKQVSEILIKPNQNIPVWEEIARKYELNLSCGFFMERTNESVVLSPDTIRRLGQRSIGLSVDIYAPLGNSD